MDYLEKASLAIKELTNIGISVLALGVVLQVLFGPEVPFLPGDIVGEVIRITNALGGEGLVGLVAIWVLATIFKRSRSDD